MNVVLWFGMSRVVKYGAFFCVVPRFCTETALKSHFSGRVVQLIIFSPKARQIEKSGKLT